MSDAATTQGTPLYEEVRSGRSEILAGVWSVTPFMTSAETGRMLGLRMQEMIAWCAERYGQEAWPLHGRAGHWQRGSTVDGYTWWGFDDAEKLAAFQEAFA